MSKNLKKKGNLDNFLKSPCTNKAKAATDKAKRQGLYAELQIASIKLKLGHFREAKVALREILHEDPKYVPALKVMSECLLNEARDFLQQCIDKNVVDNCQEAIGVLVDAINESPK